MKRLLALSSLLVAIGLAGCGGGSDSQSVSVAPTSAPGGGLQGQVGGAVSTETTQQPDGSGALPKLRLERAFGGISFNRMTGMYTAPDGRGRIFVTEQGGRIMVFEGASASPQAEVYLDITDRVDSSGSEMGLLGLAFAPDFKTSGAFYVNYTTTANGPRRTVISRFTESGAQRTAASSGSETLLLQIEQPFVNHNGGQLAFGPDGMLYIGVGDGGSGNDPQGNGQNRRVLLGKLLRIDPSGRNGEVNYRVPADNPFVGQSTGSRAEIWAYGLRNPWRFSFDAQTGALWLADVGQSAREEVDVIEKGGNYGWKIMEGSQCLGGGSNCDREGLQLPVIDYANGSGNCSITGGYVYRGQRIPGLRGAYVYGDYCSGRVWGLRYDGTKMTGQAELLDGDIQIGSFAVDSSGEVYALQYSANGGIFRLAQ